MISDRLNRFDANLTDLLVLAARADILALHPQMKDVAWELRASALVRSAAETEALFKGALVDVADEVTASSQTVATILPGLRGYLSKGCRKSPPRTSPRTRSVVEILSPSMPHESAAVSFSDLAGEGRTIRSHHFQMVWVIFDLPGAPFSVPEQVAVNRVADYRNLVAHGEETAKSLSELMSRASIDLHDTLSKVKSVGSTFAIGLDQFVGSL